VAVLSSTYLSGNLRQLAGKVRTKLRFGAGTAFPSGSKAGFARRIASQSDGRRSHLELTNKGLKALEMTRQFRMAFFSRLMSDWSDRECATFAKLRIRFTDSLPHVFGRNARLRDPKQTAGETFSERRSAPPVR